MTKLNAYISTALTNADQSTRRAIDDAVAVVREAANGSIAVYFPGDHTDPIRDAHVPAEEVFRIDRERVKSADVVILFAHSPSIGVGQELAMALESLIPVVVIAPRGTRVSRMALGVPMELVEIYYEDHDDLRRELRLALATLRPRLECRRQALTHLDANITGAKVRAHRERQGLSRDALAQRVGMTERGVAQLEESPDRQADPSLSQLRQLARVLGVEAADLV